MAVPEPANGAADSKGPEKSRLERLQAERGEQYSPTMPPLDYGEHVLDHFWAVGPTLGDLPLTHGELLAYQQNTGIPLSEWEASTLRTLSIAFLNETHRAKKRDCPAPWVEGGEGQVLAAADTRDVLRALAKL